MNTYFDHNATTPLTPSVRQAVVAALEVCGNPSSIHADGRAARMLLDQARRDVAACFEVRPEQVVFTSGGTEANNLALRGMMLARPGKTLVISGIEHPCVRNTAAALAEHHGVDVVTLGANKQGLIDLAQLEKVLAEKDVGMVSLIHGNNETGVIQPVQEAAALCQAKGVPLHTDTIQSAGKLPLTLEALNADLMTVSFHKFGGPKGVGALIVKGQPDMVAHMTGGGHERNRRAGTENVSGIAGAGEAARQMAQRLADMPRVEALRNQLERSLKTTANDLMIVGERAPRLPNTICAIVPDVEGESLVMGMDIAGFSISSGSACSSGRIVPSATLLSCGYTPEQALGVVRISLGPENTQDDVERFAVAFAACVKRLRSDKA